MLQKAGEELVLKIKEDVAFYASDYYARNLKEGPKVNLNKSGKYALQTPSAFDQITGLVKMAKIGAVRMIYFLSTSDKPRMFIESNV